MESSDEKQNLVRLVRTELESLTGALETELTILLASPQPEETYLLDFEVHSDGFHDEFPVMMFPMDKGVGQIGSPTPLLLHARSTVPAALLDAPEYEAAGIDTRSVAFGEFVDWFAACWKRAGGNTCPYPAYICHHDDIRSFELKRGEWINDEDGKWPE